MYQRPAIAKKVITQRWEESTRFFEHDMQDNRRAILGGRKFGAIGERLIYSVHYYVRVRMRRSESDRCNEIYTFVYSSRWGIHAPAEWWTRDTADTTIVQNKYLDPGEEIRHAASYACINNCNRWSPKWHIDKALFSNDHYTPNGGDRTSQYISRTLPELTF